MEFEVNGKHVFAATGGRPFARDLPAIVFLHGGGADHSVWALQTRYFAHHGSSVLALDLPGHGRSEGAALSSIAEMADWVMACHDALGVEKAALAGHSMGSLIALQAAIACPARVSALALLGTALPMAVSDMLLDAAKRDDHAAFDMVTLWGHSKPGQTGGNTNPGLWMTGTGLRLLERSGPGVLYADLKACNDYQPSAQELAAIDCPTLIAIGTRDLMTPLAAAREVEAAITGARSVVFEGCGHMMMAERPDAVLDALRDVL